MYSERLFSKIVFRFLFSAVYFSVAALVILRSFVDNDIWMEQQNNVIEVLDMFVNILVHSR